MIRTSCEVVHNLIVEKMSPCSRRLRAARGFCKYMRWYFPTPEESLVDERCMDVSLRAV
jgi:hypothetical protein